MKAQRDGLERLPTIRRQLVGLVLAVALPLIVAASWLAWQEHENRRAALGRLLLDNAHAVSAAVERELATGLVVANALAQSPLIDEHRFGDLHALAASLTSTLSGAWLVLFDASGQGLMNTQVPYGTPLPNLFKAARPAAGPGALPTGAPEALKRALSERRVVYSDLFVGSVAKRAVMSIDVPIVRGGEALFCLRLVLPVDAFQKLVRAQAANSANSGFVLVDGNGFLIARAANPARAADEQSPGTLAPAPLRAFIAQRQEAYGGTQNVDGTSVFAAHAPVAGTGWTVAVRLTDEAAFGPVRRAVWLWAAAAIALFVVGLSISIVIARRIADPMRRLAAMTESLRNDDAAALPVVHTRELAQLGQTVVDFARHSDARLRAATDAVPALISYIDRELRYQLNNKAYEDWFGHRREEIRGRHVREVLGEASYEVLRPYFESALKGVAAVFETRVPYKDGGHRDVHASYIPDLGEDGRVRGFFVLVLDVTQGKQTEEALRRANQRKDEFLAMLGHELRNPLAPILNVAEVLAAKAASEPELQWAAGVIVRQSKHLARLVDDLLDVSRIDRGLIELRRLPVDLARCVRQALENLRPQLEARRQRLSLELPAAPVWVRGDEVRLTQIVANLAGNASKFSPAEGGIFVALDTARDWARLTVRDTGTGIEPELLERIFEPFVQGSQSLERADGGLGIGLTLVRRLAELHGGSVAAQSDGAGRGAELIVRLPLCAPDTAEAKPKYPAAAPGALRVLEVDDNHDAAASLAKLLEHAGHSVALAHDGPAALQAAQASRPDAVLLDIGLPRMNGYEVAQALRSSPETAGARLIALTGYGRDEDRTASRAAGFDAHLVKPVSAAELQEALAQSPEERTRVKKHASQAVRGARMQRSTQG